MKFLGVALGSLTVVIGGYDIYQVIRGANEAKAEMTQGGDDPFGIGEAMAGATSINPGFGLYLTVAAGVVATVATLVALAKN